MNLPNTLSGKMWNGAWFPRGRSSRLASLEDNVDLCLLLLTLVGTFRREID
jgi:hypothetical protein